MQVVSEDKNHPEETIFDIGQGLIFNDAFTDIDKFVAECSKQLKAAGIDFEISESMQFQLLDDLFGIGS
ncbi:hypothetical protein S7335_929 [Synechococcus sp. PCC 7335]|nr:hypothetical protein S7335_929 [Synechococcus sp. PCC 7335]